MNKTIEGKNGVKATVVCDSITEEGIRLTTLEVEYPRIIHAEVMTHRMFSRNAASSRAIPFKKMLEQLNGMPVRFGANQAGMQDSGEHDAFVCGEYIYDSIGDAFQIMLEPEDAWNEAKEDAIKWSQRFSDAGYHKQICNRITETFQMMKVLISATEWENFYWLRWDGAADPSLEELARVMKIAHKESNPHTLRPGEWHLPYIHILTSTDGTPAVYYEFESDVGTIGHIPLEDAIKVSAARCAAVSYRNVDYSLEKSREVYDRLVGAEKKHSSALEHQATPMDELYIKYVGRTGKAVNHPKIFDSWQEGVSHVDREGNLWSGNFRGFIQNRKLLPGENYTGECASILSTESI